ncbi:MAG: NAD-glutamate dehydrogenase [Pseudonocardiaceae bacterium]|nr:NAD-glutamate dehydrogenase [Pseudonocardiaceae bacterium]
MTASPRTPRTAGPASRRDPDVVRDELLTEAERAAPGLGGLVTAYYRHAPPEDLLADEAADLAAVVASHRRLAGDRVSGRPAVRVFDPDRTVDGWASSSTVVQIVTDDMPYLVDSVMAELARIEVPVQRFVHPILVVRRDLTGTLQEVLARTDPEQAPSDALIESWMHLEIAPVTDTERAPEIEQRLHSVLNDVREVVEDSDRMADTALTLAAELMQSTLPLPEHEVADGAALLRWLADGHFTFLGYRHYELVRDEETPALRAQLASGLGVLRRDSLAARNFTPGPDVANALSPDLLVLTQASGPSTVYRPVYPYYVGVKTFDAGGAVTGEHRFLGVLTTTALHEDVLDIPVIRRRVLDVIRRAGFPLESYSGQRMLEVAQTYPRAELLSTDPDSLYTTVTGVVALAERRTLRLFRRRDPYGRFYSCLVYLPRDRYTTRSRLAMQEVLLRDLGGTALEYSARVGESQLARVHFTVHTDPSGTPRTSTTHTSTTHTSTTEPPDTATITEHLVTATRTWDDLLLEHAQAEDAAEQTDRELGELVARYVEAFPEAYKEDFGPSAALIDACRLEALAASDGLDLNFYTPAGAEPGERRFKLYLAGRRVTLSKVLPVLHAMDVEVVDERPYEVLRGDGARCWIYDFGLRLEPALLERVGDQDVAAVQQRFQEAFVAAWRGATEVDRFNALVLRAGLDWRQAAVLRGYVRYQRQAGSPYSQEYVEDVLLAHTTVATSLVRLFEVRFDPELDTDTRDAQHRTLVDELTARIDEVTGLDTDRILRSLLRLVLATLRTNHFAGGAGAEPRPYLALKLEPHEVPELPEPRPAFEIFVCSPRVEGVHLRFGPVARGGLRWSDRREDFRTEVLGLVKAQAVKNAVIVPVGAKGGFVVKRPPAATGNPGADREAAQAEGIACYRAFISGMLDLTDNLVDGTIRAPERVVRHDGDDSYLVVAADKGTASFSDIANEVAASYGFWLGDAFASGGSAGYDHKEMGITARGAWESVKRHFRELGVDTQTQPFTVVGVGDMSGDVFGNGMLLSEHIRLLAAFDHRHVFVDPDPDPAQSSAQRRRLFELPRSTWEDYDRSAISHGGGVWSRTTKRIPVGEAMRAALGIADGVTELSPPELIRAILQAPADLLYNGGIGTYVKSSTESHGDVGDKANDGVRVDGAQLRARVVGEGGNLGLTQLGRIEFARAGGKVNTDAIDNSAGVDCSDHEVNIKILLDRLVADGDLAAVDRNPLLERMTGEVADLVLGDNISQNILLGVGRAHTGPMLSVHGRLVEHLEAQRGLDRELEALPTPQQFAARESAADALTSPELATLVAHIKLALTDEVLASDLPDAEVFRARLPEYFPVPLRERFAAAIRAHPLRREITTTLLVNEVVDGGGMTFAFRLAEEMSASATDAVRAFAVATEVFDLHSTWRSIAELGSAIPIGVVDDMRLELRRLLDRTCRWLLIHRPQPLAVGAEIARFRRVVHTLVPRVPEWLRGREAGNVAAASHRLAEQGVPEELAGRVGAALTTFGLLDVAEVAELGERDASGAEVAEWDPAHVAELYYALSAHLDIDRMLSSVSELERGDRWHALARLALRDDLVASLREITLDVLRGSDPGEGIDGTIGRWERDNTSRLERARATLDEIAGSGPLDLPILSVATRRIRGMVR